LVKYVFSLFSTQNDETMSVDTRLSSVKLFLACEDV